MGNTRDFDRAAEGATISAMLSDPGFCAEALGEPEDIFGFPPYRIIRNAIAVLSERGDIVDAITVAREAESLGLERGHEVVEGLPQGNGRYLSLLGRARLGRKVKEIGQRLLTASTNPEFALSEAAEAATEALSGGGTRILQAAGAGRDALARARRGAPRVIRTGIPELDEALQLLGPGDLVVLGARPSMGKTAFAVEVARNVAMEGGVLFESLEMAPEAISMRVIAQEASVEYVRLATNALTQEEWERVKAALERMEQIPLHIADASGYNTAQVRAAAARQAGSLARQGKLLRLVIVDYLGLVRPSRESRRRDEEVAAVSAALKSLARSLGVTVLVLSQLNRAAESRQDKRPTLSDLRESGAVEQDADAVLFIHRPGYYNRAKDGKSAEIIVAKQRNGPTGTVKAVWNGPTMLFTDIRSAEREPGWDDEDGKMFS